MSDTLQLRYLISATSIGQCFLVMQRATGSACDDPLLVWDNSQEVHPLESHWLFPMPGYRVEGYTGAPCPVCIQPAEAEA